jgi:hypothetical protein
MRLPRGFPLFPFVLLVASTVGCSPAPAPVSTSQRDPSNPVAPEGTTPPIAPLVAAAPPPGHGAHAKDPPADAGASSAVYVCPMHPEVTSSAPGVCPKCNMKLVLKK